jgi:hypothetical protein
MKTLRFNLALAVFQIREAVFFTPASGYGISFSGFHISDRKTSLYQSGGLSKNIWGLILCQYFSVPIQKMKLTGKTRTGAVPVRVRAPPHAVSGWRGSAWQRWV